MVQLVLAARLVLAVLRAQPVEPVLAELVVLAALRVQPVAPVLAELVVQAVRLAQVEQLVQPVATLFCLILALTLSKNLRLLPLVSLHRARVLRRPSSFLCSLSSV